MVINISLHNAGLIDIQIINSRIILDMRYATTNNFTGYKIYDHGTCYVCKPVALKLDMVQKELESKGLGLKIWDGYRPLSAQRKLWAILPDERYVANPAQGSKHNRGTVVDVTVVDTNGNELLMPTEFDSFTPKAHRDYIDLPEEALVNRQLLHDVMAKYGFIGWPNEWWHFDDQHWEQYPILDIDL
jgi:zinc D-Ala-D-Ala dipeptidase